MQAIRDFIEWVAADTLGVIATLFPYLVAGLVALYLLGLIIGYLRVSQVGLDEAHGIRQAVALPATTADGTLGAAPRGVPYCSFDGLQFPPGARFCTRCERDLSLDCASCGATQSAVATSCYRCGTRIGAADPAPLA